MSVSPLVYLTLVSLLLGTTAAFVAASFQYPAVRYLNHRYASSFSSLFWFTLGLTPVALGGVVAACTLVSGWISPAGWITDHCLGHPHHPHLCLTHIVDNPPGGVLFWLLVVLGLGVLVTAAGQGMWSCRSWVSRIGITRTGTCQAGSFSTVMSAIPGAFTAGLFRPRAFVTEATLELLGREEVDIVVAHENEHIRKRDPLRLLLLTLSEGWLPGVQLIRRRWQHTAELECDETVVEAGHPPEKVAATILKLKRAGLENPLAGLHPCGAFGGDDLRSRIEVLLHGRSVRCGGWPLGVGWAGVLSLAVFFFSSVHHALETWLGWIAG